PGEAAELAPEERGKADRRAVFEVRTDRLEPDRQAAARETDRKRRGRLTGERGQRRVEQDRKSTRLNSSHVSISYADFRLKKKKRSEGLHASVEYRNAALSPPGAQCDGDRLSVHCVLGTFHVRASS